MEVVVTEEKKKIFRARKTMKISDRQQLESLHTTLLTATPGLSESSPPPLMNGTHKEDGQKVGDKEQNNVSDSNSPPATSPASPGSLSSPTPFLSLNLSPSPPSSHSPNGKEDPSPTSPFHSLNFELKKMEDDGEEVEKKKKEEKKVTLSSSSKESVTPASTESKENPEEVKEVKPETETKEAEQTKKDSAVDLKKDSVKGLVPCSSVPSPVSDFTEPMDTDNDTVKAMDPEASTAKTKDEKPPSPKSTTSDSSLPRPSSSSHPASSSCADVKQEKETKEEGKEEDDDKEDVKKGLMSEAEMEVDSVKVQTKKEKTEVRQTTKPSRPASTPPANTVAQEDKGSTSGLKRTLSEGYEKDDRPIKREVKRPKVERDELEAQLELKITAKAGSHHKLEKIVQQLVDERLRALQLTIFDKHFEELKERVDKIDCATKHQTAINTLQAKIARLAKKFGEANQASENKRKQEALAAAAAAAAASAAAAAATAAKTTAVSNNPQVPREMETEGPGSGWMGRNGQKWLPTNAETKPFNQPARGVTPGPTDYAITRVHDVYSSFRQFLTDEIVDIIVAMTNLQGQRTNKAWTEVDATDILAFIGVLTLAGVYKSRGEDMRSLWDERKGRALFRATMSIRRFREISSSLSFYDRQLRRARHQKDKLAPIRAIWDLWTQRLPLLYNPGDNVTVDEQLVAFKGRCIFRQYMPNKPAKYGIKVWTTADADTSYVWKCDIYTGKTSDVSEVGQGQRVVMQMTEGLQGVTVTCHNFFTSVPLAKELLQREVALVGTIRKNKAELPPKLVQKRGRATFSSVFAFTNDITAVSYVPRRGRNVILLSTKHQEAAVTEGEKKKPEIITYYNQHKQGVDNLDKAIGTYSCRRKANRWPQTVFFNMLDISAYNAYVIFTAVDPTWNHSKTFRRRLFLEELGNALISEAVGRRSHLPRTPVAAAMVREMQATAGESPSGSLDMKRGTCKLCKGQKRSKVSTMCIKCSKHICKTHQVICCNSCWKD